MKRGLLTLLLALAALSAQAQTLLVTGDYRGEIKPCGCSADGDMGGIERGSTLLDQLQPGLWLDLGNYSAGGSEQEQLKTQLFRQYFQKKGVDALLPGPREFTKGAQGLANTGLPLVLSNQKGKIPGVERRRILTWGGQAWVVYGFLSPSLLSHGTHQSQELTGPESLILEARRIPRHKILLFRGTPAELERLQKEIHFDLILIGNQAPSEEVQNINPPQPGSFIPPLKGQGALLLSLQAGQWDSKTLWITKAYAEDSSWKPAFQDYDKAVEKLFMAFLEAQDQSPDKRVYKGAAGCVSCHPKAGEIYQGTRHAKAWQSLKKVGRDFDPECIQCHTVGFGQGGFLSEERTPELANVQCENCHGPTPDHAADPNFKAQRAKVGAAVCQGCHFGSHSPKFDFKTYFPKIRHSP